MAQRTRKPPSLQRGANNSQTRDYLFQLFQQGHPPDLALDSLKRAREISEAGRAVLSRPEVAVKSSNGARGRHDED